MMRWSGLRRTLTALVAAPLLVLSMAAQCGGDTTKPREHVPDPEGDALVAAMKACGPECTTLVVFGSLLDATRNPVKPEEEYPGELTVEAFQVPPGGGSPTKVPLADLKNGGAMTQTPWTHELAFPWTGLYVVARTVAQIGFEITATVPGDWTLSCSIQEMGNQISSHKLTNRSALPVEMSVFCSYPVDLPDWLVP